VITRDCDIRRHAVEGLVTMIPCYLTKAVLIRTGSGHGPAWRFSWNPVELDRPASSAVGMFQITDGTFAEARRYCIHRHVVVEDGPWYDPRSCWFNALYTRVVPGHAEEMTAALVVVHHSADVFQRVIEISSGW
jgi:hypothetical protein